jgi:hypothetical protein
VFGNARAGAQLVSIRMLARDVEQIVVQIVEQRDVVLTAVLVQCVGRGQAVDRMPLGDDDVGPVPLRLGGVGQHDVEPGCGGEVIERLQQPDISAGRQRAGAEPFGDQHYAGAARTAEINRSGEASGRRALTRRALRADLSRKRDR